MSRKTRNAVLTCSLAWLGAGTAAAELFFYDVYPSRQAADQCWHNVAEVRARVEAEGENAEALAALYSALESVYQIESTLAEQERLATWSEAHGTAEEWRLRGEAEKAQVLARWLELAPESPEALLKQLELRSADARLDALRALYQRLPDDPLVLLIFSNALGSARRGEEQASVVEDYLARHRDDPQAYSNALFASGEPHRRLEIAEEWVDSFPEEVRAKVSWLTMALALGVQPPDLAERVAAIGAGTPSEVSEAAGMCERLPADTSFGPVSCLSTLLAQVEERGARPAPDASELAWVDRQLRARLLGAQLGDGEEPVRGEPFALTPEQLVPLLPHLILKPEHCPWVVRTLGRLDLAATPATELHSLAWPLGQCAGQGEAASAAGELLVALAPRFDDQELQSIPWGAVAEPWNGQLLALLEARFAEEGEVEPLRQVLSAAYRARAQDGRRDPAERLALTRQWLDFEPHRGDAWLEAAELSREVEGAAAAQALLERAVIAVEENEPLQKLYARLVDVATSSGDLAAAERAAGTMLRLVENPRQEGEALRRLGEVAFRQEQKDKALRYFRRLAPLALRFEEPERIDDWFFPLLLAETGQLEELFAYLEALWQARSSAFEQRYRDAAESGWGADHLEQMRQSWSGGDRDRFFAKALQSIGRTDLAMPYLEELALRRPEDEWVAEQLPKARECSAAWRAAASG